MVLRTVARLLCRCNFYLAGILHLFFNLSGNIVRNFMHDRIVGNIRGHHHANFAPGLDCVRLADSVERLCEFLEFFKTFDIGVEAFAARPGTRCAYCVRRGDDDIVDAFRFLIFVMRSDSAYNLGTFVEPPRKIAPIRAWGPST